MYHVYILKSEVDNKSYVGCTKGHKPFKLIYYESFICKTDAILREKFFKTSIGKKLKKLILENY